MRRRGFLGGLAAVFGAGAIPASKVPALAPPPALEPEYQPAEPPLMVKVAGYRSHLWKAGEELALGDLVTLRSDGQMYVARPGEPIHGVVVHRVDGLDEKGLCREAEIAFSSTDEVKKRIRLGFL